MPRKPATSEAREIAEWYDANVAKYHRLAETTRAILEGLLDERAIPYLTVTCRTKSQASVLDKSRRKSYADPSRQIHDMVGIRVITFTETDVARTSAVVDHCFNVHRDKSSDKELALGVDRIGYKSRHIVCDLGNTRGSLPEFSGIGDLLFEVQVRTVLQHAWAEFAHDRNYKFVGILPGPLRRRLFLAAGLLEIADKEFDRLAAEIEAYGAEVESQARLGYTDYGLNSTSILSLIRAKYHDFVLFHEEGIPSEEEVAELQKFGVRDLADLNALFTPGFLGAHKRQKVQDTTIGLLRSAMMYSDLERYFSRAFGRNWHGCDHSTVQLLREKYAGSRLDSVFGAHGVSEIDD